MSALWPNLVLFGWVVVVLVLFQRLPKHRALVIAFAIGWQFLPEMHTPPSNADVPEVISLPALKITKSAMATLAPLLAALIFDLGRILSFRPRWFDWPMMLWIVVPLLSALANPPPPDGTSILKDGLSQMRVHLLEWGGPYLLGRIYLDDPRKFRELLLGLVLAGLLYVPFCLFEVRFSPQLHKWIYGFYQHDFLQALRGGGYRPTVFMQHGLCVALWMVTVTVMAFWLWWSGAVDKLEIGKSKISMLTAVLILLFSTVALKSAGALSLGVLGALVLYSSRSFLGPIAVAALLLIAPLYIGGRIAASQPAVGWLQVEDWYNEQETDELEERTFQKPMFGWAPWSTMDALDTLASVFSQDRADSFGFRLIMEDRLMEKAMLQPWLGWSGWGRARLYNAEGEDMSVTDGFWIVTLGDRGLIGVFALYACMLLPACRFWWHHPARTWIDPAVSAGAAGTVVVALYMIDNVSNAMYNPVFILMAGALQSVCATSAPRLEEERKGGTPVYRSTPQKTEARPGVLSRPRPR